MAWHCGNKTANYASKVQEDRSRNGQQIATKTKMDMLRGQEKKTPSGILASFMAEDLKANTAK